MKRANLPIRRGVFAMMNCGGDPAALRGRYAIRLGAPLLVLIARGVGVAQAIHQHAAEAATARTSVEEPYSYAKIVVAMVLVVGLILFLKWGAAKFAPGVAVRPGKAMAVLSRLAVGPKQQLILIKLGRRAVLVGHSGAQMSSLCEITDAEELAHLVGQCETEKFTAPLGAFASLFKKREKEFEPQRQENALISESEEDDQLAQVARRELLGLSERIRGLSKEMNGV